MQLLLAGMEWISSTSPLGSPDGTELILEPSIMKCIYIYNKLLCIFYLPKYARVLNTASAQSSVLEFLL